MNPIAVNDPNVIAAANFAAGPEVKSITILSAKSQVLFLITHEHPRKINSFTIISKVVQGILYDIIAQVVDSSGICTVYHYKVVKLLGAFELKLSEIVPGSTCSTTSITTKPTISPSILITSKTSKPSVLPTALELKPSLSPIMGGLNPIPVNDPNVVAAANFAAGPEVKSITILSAKSQVLFLITHELLRKINSFKIVSKVVQGILYDIIAQVVDSSGICTVYHYRVVKFLGAFELKLSEIVPGSTC